MDIVNCVICCKQPQWNCWKLGGRECIELWALRCDDSKHFMSTSYWRSKDDAVLQWNNMMEDLYQGYVADTNFVDDAVFN